MNGKNGRVVIANRGLNGLNFGRDASAPISDLTASVDDEPNQYRSTAVCDGTDDARTLANEGFSPDRDNTPNMVTMEILRLVDFWTLLYIRTQTSLP